MSQPQVSQNKGGEREHLRRELLKLIVKNETVRRGHTQTGEK